MCENLKKDRTVVDNIIENYKTMEKSIADQLGLYYKLHPLNTGISREDIWLQLFQMIIPKKFVIEHSVFIIDSEGHVSGEVDLAIVDNMYTPYIFQYGRLKFIPIEAVAAVVECKSTNVSFLPGDKEPKEGNGGEKTEAGKHASTLDGWCKKIEALRTSQESIVRTAAGIVIDGKVGDGQNSCPSTQTSTRPLRIFCGYETHASQEKLQELFDFVLLAKDGKIQIHARTCTLQEWQKELNHYKKEGEEDKQKPCKELAKYRLDQLEVVKDKETINLLTFNFQLNQLLMLINNPILFPHRAYAKLFNDIGKES